MKSLAAFLVVVVSAPLFLLGFFSGLIVFGATAGYEAALALVAWVSLEDETP